jgi:hypothetical protein
MPSGLTGTNSLAGMLQPLAMNTPLGPLGSMLPAANLLPMLNLGTTFGLASLLSDKEKRKLGLPLAMLLSGGLGIGGPGVSLALAPLLKRS